MSEVILLGGFDPEGFWRVGALPLAVVLDLAIGDVPGRMAAVRWLDRLINTVEGRIGLLVGRLGGGRGGDLFGGLVVTTLVVGTAGGLVWLAVDRADAAGGPISLGVRTLLIAAGLSIRVTGDALLQGIEATDSLAATRWFATATGRPVRNLQEPDVAETAIALTGGLISGVIVAPLTWLAIGGPAAFWGFLALRLLGQTLSVRPQSENWQNRVPRILAHWAESPGAILGAALIALIALPLRLRPLGAIHAAIQAGWSRFDGTAVWSQAALAGALGVQIQQSRSHRDLLGVASRPLGEAVQRATRSLAANGVRVLQLVALTAALTVLLFDLV